MPTAAGSKRTSPTKVAVIATGNSLGRTMFVLMATGSDYDADHEIHRRQEAAMAA